ncbi:MAG: dockerin type I repeat-containing protein [Planctomycetota bacterium]
MLIVISLLRTSPADANGALSNPGTSKSPPVFESSEHSQLSWPAHGLGFVESVGQFEGDARFRAQFGNLTTWLKPSGLLYELESLVGTPHSNRSSTASLQVVRATFFDANPIAEIVPGEPLPFYLNYFLGADSARWKTGVRSFESVVYAGIYPQIDLVCRESSAGAFQYDFIVHPGADPSRIIIRFEGTEKLEIVEDGSLVVRTQLGNLVQRPPFVFQEWLGNRLNQPGRFELIDERTYGFVLGAYDTSLPLVIDPELFYVSFVGGVEEEFGSSSDFSGRLASGVEGSVYMLGSTKSPNFPVTNGSQIQGTSDVFVSRILTAGNGQNDLIWSTFLGGPDDEDAHDIESANYGKMVYVSGASFALGFPMSPCSYQQHFSGGDSDGFVARLNHLGNLEHSTYLGGTLEDKAVSIALRNETRSDCASCPSGMPSYCNPSETGNFVYIASFAGPGFPTTAGAFDESHNGGSDVAMTVLYPDLSCVCYSTYLGSQGIDSPYAIAIDGEGDVVIVGGAGDGPVELISGGVESYDCSIHFPLKKHGYSVAETVNLPWDPVFNGTRGISAYQEGFIAKIRPHPTSVTVCNGLFDAQLAFSTMIGGGDPLAMPPVGISQEYCFDVALDTEGNIVVVGATPTPLFTGTTRPINFPVLNPLPAGQGGDPPASTGGEYSGFIAMVDSHGEPIFSTYFTGAEDWTDPPGFPYEWAYGVTVDPNNKIWIAGHTQAEDHPTTSDGFQPSHSGHGVMDVYVARLSVTSGVPSFEYGSFLGGLGSDEHYGLLLYGSDLYVAGVTASTNEPSPPAPLPSSREGFPISGRAYQEENLSDPDLVEFPNARPLDCFVVRIDVGNRFRRGDADGNGSISSADVAAIMAYPTSLLHCEDAADANDDGRIDAADAAVVSTLIGGTLPSCGHDSSPDALGFCSTTACP